MKNAYVADLRTCPDPAVDEEQVTGDTIVPPG
jgi:hypothetical protein